MKLYPLPNYNNYATHVLRTHTIKSRIVQKRKQRSVPMKAGSLGLIGKLGILLTQMKEMLK